MGLYPSPIILLSLRWPAVSQPMSVLLRPCRLKHPHACPEAPGILKLLSSRYPDIKPEESERGFGPAVYYRIPGFTGCIGFISAVHGSFCKSCNRIRLTADGFLKGCLGFESNICIKPLFRQAGYKDALQKAILRTVSQKPPCHCFGGKQSGAEHKKHVKNRRIIDGSYKSNLYQRKERHQ